MLLSTSSGKVTAMNKPITSWQKTLRALRYKVNWRNVLHSSKRRKIKQPSFRFENLEPRKMLASVMFNDGQLAVTGSQDDDSIVITVSANDELEVNGVVEVANVADIDSIFVDGQAGNDFITFLQADFSGVSPGIEIMLQGGDGEDVIIGSSLNDNIEGGAGDDSIYGGEGNDEIDGGGDNDFLVGGTGEIVGDINGDGALNFLDADAGAFSQALTELLLSGEYRIEFDLNLNGDVEFTDIMFLAAVIIDGTVFGGGDDGNNIINGGTGDDEIFSGAGDDVLEGGAGDDTYTFSGTGLGVATLIESVDDEGVDSLDFSDFDHAVTINLNSTTTELASETDSLLLAPLFGQAIENIIGTEFDDILTGNALPNLIRGGQGNDTILGGAGSDNILGGDDNDSIYGGAGSDTLSGDAGNDFILGGDAVIGDVNRDGQFNFLDIPPLISLLTENVYQFEGDVDQNGVINFSDIAPFIGLFSNSQSTSVDGDDYITGGTGDDTIRGNEGIDTIQGGDGDDRIQGNDGEDILEGEAGDDTLDGGSGGDEIHGGPGADILVDGEQDEAPDIFIGGPGIDSPEIGFSIDQVPDGPGPVTITVFGLENASQGYIDFGNGVVQPLLAELTTLEYTYPIGGRYSINVNYDRNGDTYFSDPQDVRVLSDRAAPASFTLLESSFVSWENFTAAPDEFRLERSLNGLDNWTLVANVPGSTTGYDIGNPSFNQQTFYYRVTTVVHDDDAATPDTATSDPARFSSTANDQLAATASIVNSPDLGVRLEFFNEYLVASGTVDPTYTVYRKPQGEDSFPLEPIATFQNSDFPEGWIDFGVEAGEIYDYEIRREGQDLNGTAILSVAVDAGAQRHESRGSIILAIDNRFQDSLRGEIERLTTDLIGDGYFVIHEYVPQVSDEAAEAQAASQLRERIIEIYNTHDGTNREVRSVLLLGDIPVPRTGFVDPGGHEDYRAVAADILYGDVDGVYTDIGSNILTGNETNTGESIVSDFPNLPGDGRFDQDELVDDGDGSPLELSVGRVDVSNLRRAAAELGYNIDIEEEAELAELELLRRYLDKDHAFRTGIVDVENAAIINDLGQVNPNIGASTDSRSTAYAVVGRENTHIRSDNNNNDNLSISSSNNLELAISNNNFSEYTERESFLFGLVAGTGGVGGVNDTASSAGLAAGANQTVFTRFSGSFSFQYDDADSLLRSVLADEGLGLTSIWSRFSGGFSFHGTGVGGTIGESYLTTVNQGSDLAGEGNDNVYTNLLGDPTLRAHVVDAPSNTEASNVDGGVNITWEHSPEDTNNEGTLDAGYDGEFLGYHIYRASSFDGEFTRVSDADGNDLFTQSDVLINEGDAGDVWMVRAVKREVTNSGAYINLSQGAFSQEYSLDSDEQQPT